MFPIGSNKQILLATTSADQSDEFSVKSGATVTVYCKPILAGAETADIQVSPDGGVTWQDYGDGAAVELTATENSLALHGPTRFRIVKDVTAGATAIYLQR